MVNNLKKIFSYLIDIPAEKTQSRFSGEVLVSMCDGQYKLTTKNAVYSFGKKYTSFDVAFKALNIKQVKIETVLVLGFGLGSVVDLLDNHPAIKQITAVDADDIIISLAKKYLQSGLKNKTNYICEDAEKFVYETKQTFDLILFDVFIDNETPLPFMQNEFLSALKKCVSKNGILLFSKIEDSNKSRIENIQFESVFKTVFKESFSVNTDGNKVFCWINNQH